MNGIVLSAGFGTRLQPHTNKCAKPAIPFLGLSMIAYSLFYLEKANITNVVVNTHHLPETIKAAIASLQQHLKMRVQFSDEQPIILDSAGGIKQATQLFDNSQPIVVLNGDSLMLLKDPEFLVQSIKLHIELESDITLVTRHQEQAGKDYRAIWVDSDMRIKDIAKKEDTKATPLQYIGIMLLSRPFVDKIPFGKSHIFDDYLIPQLQASRAYAIINDDMTFFETGNEKDFLAAQDLCRQQLQSNSLDGNWRTLKEILDYFKVDTQKVLGSKNSIEI